MDDLLCWAAKPLDLLVAWSEKKTAVKDGKLTGVEGFTGLGLSLFPALSCI
jgi:hypothetical protein